MPRYLQHLAACYRIFLQFYPLELKKNWGDEMASVFEAVIEGEYRRSGARGVTLASIRAFTEFFAIALPRYLTRDWLIAGTLSVVITACVLGSLVGIMTARVPFMPPTIHTCR